MTRSTIRRSLALAAPAALGLIAACAAPTTAAVTEETATEVDALEGPLGELVADLMYGAPDVRLRAAGELAASGVEAAPAAQHLIAALEDGDPAVRALVAKALGVVGGDVESTVNALNRQLHSDTEEGVQSAAAAALVQLGSASGAVLLDGMQHDRASVRWQCAWSLGELGGEDALDPLVRALDDSDAHVRWSAAKAIGQVGGEDPTVVQPLIRALSDEDDQVRANAACSLGRCGERAKRAVLPLIDALRDEAASVRMQAAQALGELGPHAAQASMDLTSALNDPDPKVVAKVQAALSSIQTN